MTTNCLMGFKIQNFVPTNQWTRIDLSILNPRGYDSERPQLTLTFVDCQVNPIYKFHRVSGPTVNYARQPTLESTPKLHQRLPYTRDEHQTRRTLHFRSQSLTRFSFIRLCGSVFYFSKNIGMQISIHRCEGNIK